MLNAASCSRASCSPSSPPSWAAGLRRAMKHPAPNCSAPPWALLAWLARLSRLAGPARFFSGQLAANRLHPVEVVEG